jgi:hypothetical protein
MPANDQKVIQIILEEMGGIENRCAGYREAIIDAVADIITAERQHRVKGTSIQKHVDDKCNSVGRFLNSHRPNSP